MALAPSIPASHIVKVTPSVISTGGTAYQLNGVYFTSSAPFPIKQYNTASAVLADFGENSQAYQFALTYFAGIGIATKTPDSLFIVRFNTADTTSKLIGGTQKSKSLTDLQAIKGTLSVTVDGTEKSADIDLSTATSWSGAAEQLTTDLGCAVTFDTQLQSFIITSVKTGKDASVSYATGTASDALGLSSNGGASLDNTNTADTATSAFTRLKAFTLNFGGATHDDSLSIDVVKQFLIYNSAQNHKCWFVAHAKEANDLISNNENCLGAWVKQNNVSDSTLIYGDQIRASILLSAMASQDFSRENGRMTLDFRYSNSAVSADITSEDDANALESNGYTYYGAFATRSGDRLTFLRNVRVSGDYEWADTFLCELRLNGQLEGAILQGLVGTNVVSYNALGKAKARAFCLDTINEMINFGGIQTGITLSETQKAKVNSLTSRFDVASQLYTNGYVLIIEDASPQVRGERGSFPTTLVYTDGGSVQTINIASMAVL